MANIEKRQNAAGTSYRVKVRLKGFPPQTATFERLTDAKRWVQATETAIREGRHFKTVEAKKHTLSDMLDRYEKSVLPNLKSGADRSRHIIFWKAELGDYTLADVRPSQIAEARDTLAQSMTSRGEPRSPSTVNRYLATLSHAYTVAVKEWGWADENPLLKVSSLKEPRGRMRFLSDDERRRLLAVCKDSSSRFLYPVVVLAISTGMRHGEIINLRWKNVNLVEGYIVLYETKNGEVRRVPLAGHALECLKSLGKVRRTDTDLLFPQSRGKNPVTLQKPWITALKTAEIEDFRFHDLRHSAASYLAMNGASLAEIAEILGHKTLQMVKRYAHLSEAHTASVVAKMNEKVFG